MGSIPACAGEPRAIAQSMCCRWVDPRVRGGAPSAIKSMTVVQGRSPRARGSRYLTGVASIWPRSIPACAGEPVQEVRAKAPRKVDPRVRGGALERAQGAWAPGGRSPRARGSRDWLRMSAIVLRSIPACAGEPFPFMLFPPCFWVDPRVRGGAVTRYLKPGGVEGRSPRARGSLTLGNGERLYEGSIPACAGEPQMDATPVKYRQVDPRVRGGAGFSKTSRQRTSGRSPRARGSRSAWRRPNGRYGSIPACAGEPPAPP